MLVALSPCFKTQKVTHQSRHCKKLCVFVVILVRGFPAFFRIRTEYGEIRSISPYSVRMREKCGPEQLWIWTIFTQWKGPEKYLFFFQTQFVITRQFSCGKLKPKNYFSILSTCFYYKTGQLFLFLYKYK